MARSLVAALCIAGIWLGVPASPSQDRNACIPPIKCCRICHTGKACGNTCIAADKQCHKGRGCACDVAEVCAEDP